MNNRKLLLFFTFLFVLIQLSCSYKPDVKNNIFIKGSDTMLYLTKLLAEEFMKKNPGISIYVEGGGTAAGIKDFVKGEVDICTASRSLKGEEVKILASHFGSVGISFIIAKDALTVFINPENKVRNFSLEQLKKIFTGGITNWKELGGEDHPVKVLIRNPNSGTYLYFKEHVLGGEEYSEEAEAKSTTQSIIEEILSEKYAISYGGIGYQKENINALIERVEPTEENVRNDLYPVSRYLYFYTQNTPKGLVKDFIDWVIGAQGQKIVQQSGYISLWKY